MAIPIPDFAAWIASQIAAMDGVVTTGPLESQTSTAAIKARFDAMLVANTAPKPPPITVTITPPPDWLGVVGTLGDDSLGRLQAMNLQDRFLNEIKAGTADIDFWFAILTGPGPQGSTTRPIIRDAAEAAAIKAKLSPSPTTESRPDPSWSETITTARAAFGCDVEEGYIDHVLGR